MAEDSDLEKTEDPTSRRIEQAREQGQVPHSRELGTFLVLIVAGSSFWMMGSGGNNRYAITPAKIIPPIMIVIWVRCVRLTALVPPETV